MKLVLATRVPSFHHFHQPETGDGMAAEDAREIMARKGSSLGFSSTLRSFFCTMYREIYSNRGIGLRLRLDHDSLGDTPLIGVRLRPIGEEESNKPEA